MATTTDFFTGQRRSTKQTRNFIQENITRLKEMKNLQSQPLSTKSGPSLPPRFFRDIKNSKLNSGLKLRRDTSNLSLTDLVESNVKESFIREYSLPSGFRHQGSQTVEENDLDSLYHEGVIRYPSTRHADDSRGHVKRVREMGLQTEKTVIIRAPSPTNDASLQTPLITNSAGDSIKDFVKFNAMIPVLPKRKTDLGPDPNRPPPTYQMGVIPKYLREQKKEQDRIKDVEIALDPDCPPGHTVLPEEERVKHLEELKQHYTTLINELNQLPVRTDTLRTRRRRLELEKELDKIDAGIKIFSRDKLFIKNKV